MTMTTTGRAGRAPRITRESLMTLEGYAKARNEFRAKVMEHKKNRIVHLGEHLTLLFASLAMAIVLGIPLGVLAWLTPPELMACESSCVPASVPGPICPRLGLRMLPAGSKAKVSERAALLPGCPGWPLTAPRMRPSGS